MKIVGHRGARGLAPENTIVALRKGLEYGVDEIEIDVRVTKDNKAVLNHDRAVHAANGQKFLVPHHTLKELQNFKPDLITLEDAILEVKRRVPLLVELKRKEPVTPVVKVINSFLSNGWHSGDFLLGSKSQRTLEDLHKELPEIQKVVIERWSGLKAGWRAKKVNTRRISMNQYFLWFGFIAAMHRRGFELYAYTLNNPTRARKWFNYGLAGAITDYPDRMATYKK